MAIEDSFFTTYAFGTQKEINKYLEKDRVNNKKEFNIGFIVEAGVTLIAYATPVFLDILCRVSYGFVKNKVDLTQKEGLRKITASPGIVGIIREYIEEKEIS